MSTEIDRAAALLNGSYYAGLLSKESAGALAALPQHCEEVARALGSDATSEDVMLVTILVDDSISIEQIAFGPQAEERGHDRLLEVLEARPEIQALVHTRFLNQGTFSPYRHLSTARRLKGGLTFSLNGTPLYRQSLLTLGSVIAKTRQASTSTRSIRTVTLIITDGEDNASADTTASHVRFLVRDMMEIAGNHIVAGMGIGEITESYERVFRAMGIPKDFIFTAGATADDIDKMFNQFEKKILEPATKSKASFGQLLAGSSDAS